jgi:hypothetical protein
MASDHDDRLQSELSLLEAMYPEHVAHNLKTRELKYTRGSGSFTLRLPEGYLNDQLPEVLAASIGRRDAREPLRFHVKDLAIGEEGLDSIVSAFSDLVDAQVTSEEGKHSNTTDGPDESSNKATVIVWLHHLLNTNKRKQALSPPPGVSGVTKPGYPGVLIYSGPASAVQEHVNELKTLNWQAFQIRLESDEEWALGHGSGVKEVESMKEVVAEVGEMRKEAFMEAMRMK